MHQNNECIRTMEEKERLKREKQERKEMLKQERERKREMKQKAREDRIFRDHSSDTEYLPQRGRQAREGRGRTGFATDQEEQNERPLSTKLRGVGGRGHGRGRKEVTVPAPNNAHSDHSSDTEYLPQRGRQARERRGRTGFATNTDQEEQNERPLSTKLRGVGGRGRGKGRKEVTVPANNAHSDHSSDTEYLPQRGRQAREGRGRTGFATDQEEQNERPLSTELRGVGGRGRGRGRKEVTVPAPNNAHSDHSSDTEYLPQRGRQAREGRGRTGFATNADQEEQNERPLSTELRGVGGRGRGRGRKEVTVPAPNNAHSELNSRVKESSLEAEFLPGRRSTRQRVPPLYYSECQH